MTNNSEISTDATKSNAVLTQSVSTAPQDKDNVGQPGDPETFSVNTCSGNTCSSNPCGTEYCTARPQFKWSEFLVSIVLWALLARIQSWPSMIVVSIAILTWLFGCYRTRDASGVVLQAIYAPAMFLMLWLHFIEGRSNVLHSLAILPLQSEMASVWKSSSADWIAAAVISCIFLGVVSLIRFYPKTQPGIFFVLMLLGWSRAIGWAAISFANSLLLPAAGAF